MTLTDTQEEGLEALKEFIESPKRSGFFLLKGYAGTGKSTLVGKFIDWYVSNKGFVLDDIVVTAPTNKAVRVLKQMSENDEVDHKTLHSLLGIRPKIDENGQEEFVKDKTVKPTIHMYGCLIVDEASMIDDYIFDLLIDSSHDLKVIFVGDMAQIPPVNHFHSKPMLVETQEELGIEVFSLTEIIRQAKDNPIIKTSIDIRKGTFERTYKDDRDENGFGVFQLNNKNKEQVYDLIKEAFLSKEFKDNPDHAKIIAWRNSTVKSFNDLVRAFLYYRGVNKIVLGEKLILNRPILDHNTGNKGPVPVLFVNDDLIVTGIDIEEKTFYNKTIKYYLTTVKRIYSDKEYEIKILHEDSQVKYDSILNTLKGLALSKKKSARGKAWKTFYEFKEIFADVSYNYSITCHKSQGSTYDKAFVCYSDITVNQNIPEMQRILYTAVTRPKETLYIL